MTDLPPSAPGPAPLSTWRKITTVVLILLGAAAILFALRSCQQDTADEAAPEPSATVTEKVKPRSVLMSTVSIENKIKTRLETVSNRKISVECPKKVKQKVGTTFDCDVFFADEPGTAAVSTADVEIDGPDGHFTWKATPKEQ
ncbi:hypothetical protein ASD11_05875 [Aeromicrobium sp. Root495]|uniref:DUF4333 domain-containing protein n=1 Tax=Aeromicrobium sp. Root495 TaxID=1736550 RepID=UPI0006F8F650|nr:DUF4333 domain-containing protein [Aeromicrobium sp. Root495]KQY59123.1 hypothetical protein ASD11_05875 [Aeromicrobium sp. Root495]